MEHLIEEGADVNKVVEGRTPLIWAFQKSQVRAAEILLEKGADFQVRDAKGRDLWTMIIETNPSPTNAQGKCLALIVEKGFEPKMSLLETVKVFDCKEIVHALVDAGEDLEQRDENGWTPLHHAAIEGHEYSTEALLEAGADPNSESTKTIQETTGREDMTSYVSLRYEAGTRPADIANLSGSRGQKSCSQLIKEHGGEKNESLDNVYLDHH